MKLFHKCSNSFSIGTKLFCYNHPLFHEDFSFERDQFLRTQHEIPQNGNCDDITFPIETGSMLRSRQQQVQQPGR